MVNILIMLTQTWHPASYLPWRATQLTRCPGGLIFLACLRALYFSKIITLRQLRILYKTSYGSYLRPREVHQLPLLHKLGYGMA